MTTTLFDPADLAELGAHELTIPLDLIDANPHNPRRSLSEIEALAENIRTFGLLQPVTLRRVGERYELLGGHRRRAAYQWLVKQEPHDPRWRAIPAVIRDQTDDDAAMKALISGQVHINQWSPKEEAAALERLVQDGNKPGEVGQALNKSASWASKRLRVYTDSVLSGYVQSGKLKPGIAEELLPVLDLATKKRLADEAARESLSQDQVKGRVRALRLDIQLRQINRLSAQLLELLSSVDPRNVPIEATRDLWTIHGRIEVLARGTERKVPTVEQAERAAGVRKTRRKVA